MKNINNNNNNGYKRLDVINNNDINNNSSNNNNNNDDDDDLLSNVEIINNKKKKPYKYLGLILMAISALVFSTMSMIVNVIGKKRHMDSFNIMTYRSAITSVFCIISLLFLGESMIPDTRLKMRFLGARAIVGFISMSGFYYGLTTLTLGDATCLIFTMPIFTVIFAFLFLSEPFGRIEIIAAFFSFGGIILVARPTIIFGGHNDESISESRRLAAIFITLMAAAFGAGTNVLVRHLGESVHYLLPVLYFSMFSTIGAPISGYLLQDMTAPTSLYTWLLIVTVGLLGFLGQTLKTKAFQIEKAGRASMIRNLDIVFSFIFQALVLHDDITITSIFGAVSILTSAGLIGFSASQDTGDHDEEVESRNNNGLQLQVTEGVVVVVDDDEDDDDIESEEEEIELEHLGLISN